MVEKPPRHVSSTPPIFCSWASKQQWYTNSVDAEFIIGVYGNSIGTYILYGGVLELGVSKMYVSKSYNMRFFLFYYCQ